MSELTGRIHSLESFGTVDGPGIRYVVFFQGCPMRCLYCHNPDTWEMAGGAQMTADEIIEKITRNREFYTSGGITATGGEPMLQIDFLTELFTKAKQNGIHTALDTCGILFDPDHTEKVEKLMAVTDLVLLDIKHMFDEEHKKLLALGRYLKTLTNMEKLEVLPYHSMGKVKYDSLGIEYPLLGTPQLSKAEAAQAEAIIREGMAE